jgi:hypothetical protein
MGPNINIRRKETAVSMVSVQTSGALVATTIFAKAHTTQVIIGDVVVSECF